MEVVADLDKPGATFLAAKGGKPGLGNRILAGKTTKFGRLRKHMPESKTTGSPDTFRLSVADIPGLIDGAHRNVGLGHDFLRHIERTKILMYVLDTAGSEGRDPLEDFTHLQRELELYAPGISSRPSLIVANKMDEQGTTCTRIDIISAMMSSSSAVGYLNNTALHKVDIDTIARTLRWMIESYSKLTKAS
ncbi:hypothetical protein AM588_10011047 [Phytophthora nicotianae]|uniref:Uncharacterized protein n=1 Tax=Phytophthora nicotianae TaxID=4792 RepID=A0A0W8DLK3_PHYNI|nr:hypothetical protein AM588_10011047 [Phytophthora nicotianae]